ncbi:Txe/YoeB family addiction module toxin [Saccharopolyspora gregorii]|uniref:Endoribonuclease YoeB n=1 Tax=Saccharopolyspora gregorii TaxID=33914 RepID=A0ABP6S2D8_9PSEU|nr:Txe/YoeB family addiction module toxin [Saccharopolyspora gregorii]
MKLVWDENAWADYVWWQTQDRKVLKRINTLLKDVERNGNEGIGKPEPLKHGFWSRRITDEHRLVYRVHEDQIQIAACRYHYGS